MGEVAMSSEEVVNLEVEERETDQAEKKVEQEEDGSTTTVVRWERFLPKKALRVLLVEADDSTRQIVAALLRKCSYRVAAVPDGLKAWEVLKGKPHNIDLILTEVDLPSISGFALLTLIMEHEICKNIPVIMMSWHDSVSTVYKCMLRGAADFLVKPVRKNELRNLWQHVWRRQSSTKGENGPQDDNFAQQKVEATAENNGVSNHSSGYMACVQRNRECIEKGSDAQSSCTKPDMEAERAYTENMQDLSQPRWNKSPASDMQIQRGEELGEGEEVTAMAQDDYIAPKSQREHPNIISEACDIDKVFVNASREAIDLIGAFDNYTKCSYRSASSNIGTNKVDSSLLLDLSLRRSHPNGSVNQVSDERHALNHSDASAFSRYINRALQPLHSSASICNQQKDHGTNSERQLSNHALDYNSDAHGFGPSAQKNMLSVASTQCGQAEVTFSCPQQTVFPIPVRGIGLESLCTPYGSVGPPIFCTQQSPVNGFQTSSLETRNPQQCRILFDQNANNSTNQTENKERHKLDSSDDRRHFSSATDQSTTSSFYNGTASHLNSNGNVDQVAVVHTAIESGNEEGLSINDRNCYRSVHREAALNKFRLKRKDRCYEKKVRYESRKKLAEQRPRVKGQFVRHMQTDPTSVETHCGYSLDC